ncbi:hypothetical protein [Mechercharimyces sp. CAU 1602]|uniref:hypothetical protein n=1 Tax=Mechercharimyces sp. CAU 1602 TaxID=2973933 RepID=UPI002163ED17|nr:hypothetical protein [Mechercharimyces sp. CAU 1602]MCS1351185.1 hypothetical protein [Mechercharimyces sp. CAU 1602]
MKTATFEVTHHNKRYVSIGGYLQHEAHVTVSDPIEEDKESIDRFAFQVAESVRYSPYGYDMFNVVVERMKEDQYIVTWGSWTTCD